VREAAEIEERSFYNERAPQEWLDALAPLGTDWNKPFLEEAPVLIAIFAQKYGVHQDGPQKGEKFSHYYVPESVGIASGFLIAALHHAGLATLTHTPNPMSFLNKLCGRPSSEKADHPARRGLPQGGLPGAGAWRHQEAARPDRSVVVASMRTRYSAWKRPSEPARSSRRWQRTSESASLRCLGTRNSTTRFGMLWNETGTSSLPLEGGQQRLRSNRY
jgi:hypothetical protein